MGALLRSQVHTQSAEYPPTGLSESVRALPEWIQLGCGDKPYNCAEKGATFGTDGQPPEQMPDLSNHSNFMAEALTPEMYERLRKRATLGGTTLADIIKTVGAVACDEDSYEVFA